MNKRIFGIITAAVIIAGTVPAVSAAEFTYITNEAELRAVANNLSGSYALANDIVLTGDWEPIGADPSTPFTGTFDGGGYSISGLTIKENTFRYAGLFGATNGAVIENLSIDNCNINTDEVGTEYYIGAVTAYNTGGTIRNCTVTGDVNMTMRSSRFLWGIPLDMTDAYGGGIAGYNTGVIERCNVGANVSVHSDYYAAFAGGIAGYSTDEGRISECQLLGGVAAYSATGITHGGAGGITSHNYGTIENCCVKAYIATSGNYANSGGITSRNGGKISNCFYYGTVRSMIIWQMFPETSSGNMASENNGTIENSYYITETGSTGESTGSGEGEGAEKIPEGSAGDMAMYPSLDFGTIWLIAEDGKPGLRNVKHVEAVKVDVPVYEEPDAYFGIVVDAGDGKQTVITVMNDGKLRFTRSDNGTETELSAGDTPELPPGVYLIGQ